MRDGLERWVIAQLHSIIGLMMRWKLLFFMCMVLLTGCVEDEQPIVVPTETGVGITAVTPTTPATPTHIVPTATEGAIFIPLIQSGEPNTPVPLTAVPLPTSTPTPAFPTYDGPTIDRNNIGVQIYLHRVDVPQLFKQLTELGVGWVKVQVSWKLYQPAPDQYSEERFAELDQMVQVANEKEIAVLLSVSKAPEWSRPTTELDGPPLDNGRYQDFMHFLASRYVERVAAYELWNEPNLQREWNGMPLSAEALVALIGAGVEGVRSADGAALLISGAPAVTGINDGIHALDDRQYFEEMLVAGVADLVDGLGVHPYGWANPPETTAVSPDLSIPSHNDHPSFFFQDTLHDYNNLLTKFGIENKQLWVTEFGWGSFEKFGQAPPAEAAFMAYVSEWQQAAYTQQAFALAHDWPWVGPMVLWNLNFAPWLGPDFSESGYSLLRLDGTKRPVFEALATMEKE